MQLKLTWRVKDQPDMDLLVSDEQKIAETMGILVEKGLLDMETADSATYMKSLRTNNQVNIFLTYQEAEIYSGDILVLVDTQKDEE